MSAGSLAGSSVRVRGNASAEELAAVLAVLARGEAPPPVGATDGYRRWRAIRLAALARDPSAPRSG